MSSHDSRLIDNVPTVSPRPMEMQVLALGMSRTGTMSMQVALQRLGYKSYHMLEAGRTCTFSYWLEALKAKYSGEKKPYQREELDKLLGGYSAVTDIPCIMFVDELLAAYPDAKVVLTERDVDSWIISMNRTIFELLSWKSFYYIAPLEPKKVGPYWKTLNFIVDIWTGGDFNDRLKLQQSYRDHYNHVRSAVPEDKLLEFQPKDGFEPLCKFLDKPLPEDAQYPHINQPDNIIRMHKALWWGTLKTAAKKVAGTLGACGVAAGAIWYYRYKA